MNRRMVSLASETASWTYIAFCLLVVSHRVSGEYFIGYMQDSCRCSAISRLRCNSFTLAPVDGAAGFVLLSRDSVFDREFYCTYTIRAPANMAVVLRINWLQLPMLSHGGCRASVLRLFDSNSTKEYEKQLIGVCGSALPAPNTFMSTGNEMTLDYRQSRDVANDLKSFNITFTYVATRKAGCREWEFTCRSTGHCIPSSLVCDGVYNCLDNSDESQDFEICGKFVPSSNPFLGTTVGVGVFLFVVALLLCVITARVKHNQQRLTECASGVSRLPSHAAPGTLEEPFSSADRQLDADEEYDVTTSDDILRHQLRHHTPNLLNSRRLVTVISVPQPCEARSTPPPAYDSLFPTVSRNP